MSVTIYNDPHFIKPLFPGFEHELLIPVDFMKNLEGQKGETAVLSSRQEGKLWPVKINGGRFGDGWKQFVQDHDLQIGDCLLFRHEGHLVFYVLVFGHNTCEREYPPFTKKEPLEVQEQNLPYSRSDHLPFAGIEERPSEIEEQNLPRDAISGSPLFVASGEEPIEVPEHNLPKDHSREEEPTKNQQQNLPNYSITGSLEKIQRNKKARATLEAKAISFVSEHPHCVVNVTPASIKTNRLQIPSKFMREIGLYSQTYWVILEDENSDYWRAVLSYSRLNKKFWLGGGWAAYHSVHKIKAGDLLIVELVKNGITPVFRIPKKQEDSGFRCEQTCQNNSDESRISKKYKVFNNSSAVNKKSYFLAEIKSVYCNFQLHIPRSFSKQHLIDKEYNHVILRDQEGRSWPAKLGLRTRSGDFHIADGWKEFAAANQLKLGDSLAFEFIENGKRPAFNIYGFQEFSGKNREDVLPHFFVNMQTSCCLRDRRLRIPNEFARKHCFSARKCSTLTITNEDGKSWEVSVRLNMKGVAFMHSGIMDFVLQNQIGEDDVFMLELVKGGDIPELKYHALKQVKERNQEGILGDCEDVKPKIF